MVPFIDLGRLEEDFLPRWLEKVASLSGRCQFIAGPEVTQLETRLAGWAGVRHAITCANGTDAIQLALRALGVGRGDVVLVPDATFWATFEAVVNVNATPVTVDVCLRDGGVDFDLLARALVEAKPKAVVLAHLYGWASARLSDLRSLCEDHGVPLIEDGAQCFGVNYLGTSIYSGARIATTSFYPAKVLGAAGDGGAVFTSDPELAGRVRMLANHGRSQHYAYEDVGWNSRLDSLQAAYLNISLDYLEARIASRRSAARFYREHLPSMGLEPMAAPEGFEENGYCNVLLVADERRKSRIEESLRKRGIGFGNIYPGSISAQAGASAYLGGQFGGEAAAALGRQVINLPLFPYMTRPEFDEIIEALQIADRGLE